MGRRVQRQRRSPRTFSDSQRPPPGWMLAEPTAQTCWASAVTGWTSLGFVDQEDQEDFPWLAKKKAHV